MGKGWPVLGRRGGALHTQPQQRRRSVSLAKSAKTAADFVACIPSIQGHFKHEACNVDCAVWLQAQSTCLQGEPGDAGAAGTFTTATCEGKQLYLTPLQQQHEEEPMLMASASPNLVLPDHTVSAGTGSGKGEEADSSDSLAFPASHLPASPPHSAHMERQALQQGTPAGVHDESPSKAGASPASLPLMQRAGNAETLIEPWSPDVIPPAAGTSKS